MLSDFLTKKMPRKPLARLGAAFFNCLAPNWRDDWDNLELIVPIEHFPELTPGKMIGHREEAYPDSTRSNSTELVCVGAVDDTKHELIFDGNDTVTVPKCRLLVASGVAVDQQLLTFGGKQLQDERTLRDYGIEPDSIVQLTARPRGGTKSPVDATFIPDSPGLYLRDLTLTQAQLVNWKLHAYPGP
jgi:hypothetical protein